jgi:hypothetical protein
MLSSVSSSVERTVHQRVQRSVSAPIVHDKPPIGVGFRTDSVVGCFERFSAFGVSGWAIPASKAAGPLSVRVITSNTFDVAKVDRPRLDVVLRGYNSVNCGFHFPLTRWLATSPKDDELKEDVCVIIMQGEEICYRTFFRLPRRQMLVPDLLYNVETAGRSHVGGWLDCDDPKAALSLVLTNGDGEQRRFAATNARKDLAVVSERARAFRHSFPLLFGLRQQRLSLSFEYRAKLIHVTDVRLPKFAAYLDGKPLQRLANGEDVGFISGWALNGLVPTKRPCVVLSEGGKEVWRTRATMRRPDIAAATKTDGFVGYLIPLAALRPGAPWTLAVSDDDEELVMYTTETGR